MEKHYFIGIKVPLETARTLVRQREAWGLSSHKRLPVAEDLHITLLFIGGDPQGEIRKVADLLEEVEHEAFGVNITGTGHFGKEERPRVIYAAVKKNERMETLQHQIKNALKNFQLSPDNKPFVPHITLANKWKGQELLTEMPQLKADWFTAEEFSLFRIEPGNTPRYTAVKTYKLKDDA